MQYFIADKITEMKKKLWANEQNDFLAIDLHCIWKQHATNMQSVTWHEDILQRKLLQQFVERLKIS